MPATSQAELGLRQPFLVFQCKFPDSTILNIEVLVKSQKGDNIRLMFSSAFREYSNQMFHIQIPFDKGIPRNVAFD